MPILHLPYQSHRPTNGIFITCQSQHCNKSHQWINCSLESINFIWQYMELWTINSLRRVDSESCISGQSHFLYFWSATKLVVFSFINCCVLKWWWCLIATANTTIVALLKILKSAFKIFVKVFVFTKTFKIFVRKTFYENVLSFS